MRARLDWQAALESLARAQDLLERPPLSEAERERILRERARVLARAFRAPVEQVSLRRMIVFSLGGERYAFPLRDFAEVISHPAVVPVPGAPPAIAGVMQVRGEIRPVFDLARLLGFDRTLQDAALLMRVRHNEIGFQVGPVEGIFEQPASAPDTRQEQTEGKSRVLLVTPDLIQLLSPEILLAEIQEQFGAF